MRVSAWALAIALFSTVAVAGPAEAADPKKIGQWSAPFWEGGSLPIDPPTLEKGKRFPTAVSTVVLPDGRILYWNGLEGSEDIIPLGLDAFTVGRARVMTLSNDGASWTIPKPERGRTDDARPSYGDMWCAGQVVLHDGAVLIAGGNTLQQQPTIDRLGSDESTLFHPKTNSFEPTEEMEIYRWYPTLITLPTGKVLVVAGEQALFGPARRDLAINMARELEVYDPKTKRWGDAGLTPYSLPYYPQLHLLPGGKVYYPGVGINWGPGGFAADAVMWGMKQTYDTRAGEWSVLGPSTYGARSSAMSMMLKLEPPYDSARIVVAGGTLGTLPGTAVATTISEVETFADGVISGETSVHMPADGLLGDASQLRNRRWYGSPVILPTGEVLALNGGDMDAVLTPAAPAAVRTVELYDPKTNTWRELATATRDRVYHSSAVLLPDGRVLVGGHAPIAANGLPPGRSSPHRDSTFEIFSPPYLFRGPRPEIDRLQVERAGEAIGIDLTTPSTDIVDVTLVRLPAVTHTVDADMRAVALRFTRTGAHRLTATLPKDGDGTILPPGPYSVFVMKRTPDGPTPSVSKTIMIAPAGGTRVIATLAP